MNMKNNEKDIDKNFEKLEIVVYNAIVKINELKDINKKITGEINELKRLYALSEKKAERLKQDLEKLKASGQEAWQVREQDVKNRLKNLSAKLSVFEKRYSIEN
ncbi:MAG: hypothetical protein J7K40_08390 [candidate division Zixibacteria bacterium]|nr:hypothetical protein [candidate division Zixibacteria bacterium]